MSIQKQLEDAAFEVYRQVVNNYCNGCSYSNCKFRNKRERLKEQRIDNRRIRCQKEADELKSEILNKKLP